MSMRKSQAGDIRQIAAATLAGKRRAEKNTPTVQNRTTHASIEALCSRSVKHQKGRNLLEEADFSPSHYQYVGD
jgi:hypothetical protein